MPRVVSAALLLLLVGATAVAFAVTEGLKLEPSPVGGVRVDKVAGPHAAAHIRFRLRKKDRLTLSIVDAQDRQVAVLIDGKPRKKGIVRATWRGAGVPDGFYRPRVHLRRAHKTIVLPNPIRVDTKPPRFVALKLRPRVLRPGRHVSVVYRLSEVAHVSLYANGKRVVVGRAGRPSWKLDWYAGGQKPGAYVVSVRAEDLARNVSKRVRAGRVVIPLQLLTQRVRVKMGEKFVVQLRTGGRAYHWRFAGVSHVSRGQLLPVRAPAKPGRYALVIRQDGLAQTVRVTVRK